MGKLGICLAFFFLSSFAFPSEPIQRGNEATAVLSQTLHNLAQELDRVGEGSLAGRVRDQAAALSVDDLAAGEQVYLEAVRTLLQRRNWSADLNRLTEVFRAAVDRRILLVDGSEPSPGEAAIAFKRAEKTLKKLIRDESKFGESELNAYLALVDLSEVVQHLSQAEASEAEVAELKRLGQTFAALSAAMADADNSRLGEFWRADKEWKELQVRLSENALGRNLQFTRLDFESMEKALQSTSWSGGSALLENLDEGKRILEEGMFHLSEHRPEFAARSRAAALRQVFPIPLTRRLGDSEIEALVPLSLDFFHLRNEFSVTEPEAVRKAEALYLRCLESRDEAEFRERAANYKAWLNTELPRLSKMSQTQIAPLVAPALASKQATRFLHAVRDAYLKVKSEFLVNRTPFQKLRWNYNANVENALDAVSTRLSVLEQKIRSGNSLALVQIFFRHQPQLELLLGYLAEAAMNRASSTEQYAKLLIEKLDRLESSNGPLLTPSDVRRLRDWNQKGADEFVRWNIVFTRENFSLGAICGLVIVEGLSFQWETVPATLAWAGTIGRGALVATSSLNIADRVQRSGFGGLLTTESAIDMLVVLNFTLPAAPRAITATTRWGKIGQNLRNTWGLMNRDAGTLLVGTLGVLGTYELVFAESIAQDLRARGIATDAWEVRRRASIHLAWTLVMWKMNRDYNKAQIQKYGSAYTSEMDKLKFKNTFSGKVVKSLNPLGGFANYRRILATAWNNGSVGPLRAMGLGVAIPAYLYIFVNESILMSYTTLDSLYERHVDSESPLPELRPGEAAVLAVGLDPADVLYAGALSKHYSLTEQQKYGARYAKVEYTGPQDLFQRLEEHAKRFGPIRYLKIVSHGLPGMLVTREAYSTPFDPEGDHFDHLKERGYINVGFLTEHSEKLRKSAGFFMAPDAQVTLVACLVGSNYDSFNFGKDIGRADIGDAFLDEFSQTLLVNRGRLDASTRILLGLDMVYGSLLAEGYARDTAMREGIVPRVPLVPIRQFGEPDSGGFLSPQTPGPDANAAIPAMDFRALALPTLGGDNSYAMYINASHRLATMVWKMPWAWKRYGVDLEGGFWESRYKYRIVK